MAQTAEILEALPPAQMQPTGLAQFDLNVTATPLVITWDKDAVSTLLDTVLAQYAGLEVQEADVPAIKNEMAGLNRLKERMDNARKDIKRRIAGPLDGFDAEVKALIARIVEPALRWTRRSRTSSGATVKADAQPSSVSSTTSRAVKVCRNWTSPSTLHG